MAVKPTVIITITNVSAGIHTAYYRHDLLMAGPAWLSARSQSKEVAFNLRLSFEQYMQDPLYDEETALWPERLIN